MRLGIRIIPACDVTLFMLLFIGFLASPALPGEIEQPDEIMIDHIAREYTGVPFSHSMHTMMAGDCGSCHHHAGSNEELACLSCHSLEPTVFRESVATGFIPCGNCHGEHDPENPGKPSLKVAYHRQCFTCHGEIGGIGETPAACSSLCHERK